MTSPYREQLFAGIDAGATKIRVALADAQGRLLAHREGPGVNAAVQGPDAAAQALLALLVPLLGDQPLRALVIGLAGAWSARIRTRLARKLSQVLKVKTIGVWNDALVTLLALAPKGPAMLLNVGTGAVLVGTGGPRNLMRIDGWGPLAGDAGSGYWIGRQALETALKMHDGRAPQTGFAKAVLHALRLKDPGQEIYSLYAGGQGQAALASLAPVVIRLARRRDPAARRILAGAARALAETVQAGLQRMPRGQVRLLLSGGLAKAAPEILTGVRRLARRRPARLIVDPREVVPEAAALRLAVRLGGPAAREASMETLFARLRHSRPRPFRLARGIELPVTEQSNLASAGFSRLSPLAMVRLMNREDALVAPAIQAILPAVARAVVLAERRLRRGGRLIYVGAGTSGRLGILDASEAPPTFGVPRSRVQGVIAGGRRAVTASVEGAEDDAGRGADAIRRLAVKSNDVVVGLSASGGARYVLAAVQTARKRRAATIAITCTPRSPLTRAAGMTLVPAVGPEVITGSTRLKAGTAQKMLLNMLSTCVMARLGRVHGNLMTRLKPVNRKLRARAVRIGARQLGVSEAEAERRLIANGWSLAAVLQRPPHPPLSPRWGERDKGEGEAE